MNRKQVIALTQAHRNNLEALGVKTLELFGSVARDEDSPESDIDFLVEFTIEPTLFDLFRVQHYLEDLLGSEIDLGTRTALKAHLREPVIKDAIRVFLETGGCEFAIFWQQFMPFRSALLGCVFETFEDDETLVKAVLYDFIIIGEASANMPAEVQQRYP